MKKSFFLVSVLFSTILLAQQKGHVSGTIIDAEMQNEPMLFANVTIKGTEFKTRTNIFGNFEIENIEPGNHMISVSFAGYETKEIPVTILAGDYTILQTQLTAKKLDLDEIAELNIVSHAQKESLKSVLPLPNK